jgi:hypothetical protein
MVLCVLLCGALLARSRPQPQPGRMRVRSQAAGGGHVVFYLHVKTVGSKSDVAEGPSFGAFGGVAGVAPNWSCGAQVAEFAGGIIANPARANDGRGGRLGLVLVVRVFDAPAAVVVDFIAAADRLPALGAVPGIFRNHGFHGVLVLCVLLNVFNAFLCVVWILCALRVLLSTEFLKNIVDFTHCVRIQCRAWRNFYGPQAGDGDRR